MIIDFSYDVDSYQELLTHYGNWSYTCPVCNTVEQWQRHGTYLRYFLVSEDNGYEIKITGINRVVRSTNETMVERSRNIKKPF